MAPTQKWRSVVVAAIVVAAVATFDTPPVRAATRYLDSTFAVDVQRDVVYGTAVNVDGSAIGLRLDLYTPRGDTASGRPVFIFAHGGGFFAGDKQEGAGAATELAKRGYVAASINYRLGPEAVTDPIETPLEATVVDNAKADMQASVRWFRANASSLRIDGDRIAVGGQSAGAVTALGVALGADNPVPGSNPEQLSSVCTAVSISGASDPSTVGPLDAGAIFFHGTLDTTVPYARAAALRDAMIANGLAVSWNELPQQGHELSSATLASLVGPTVQWLYERVVTAPFPCSPAVGRGLPVAAGGQTPIVGQASRSGVVSLVIDGNGGPGFVQSLPCGTAAGASSNLNADAAQQTRSVLAVVQFGADGRSCLHNQMTTHLLADVQGYFTAGSFDDVPDTRLVDTRSGPRPPDGARIVITGRAGATGVVSLVMTETSAAGYLQVLGCDEVPGASSNLNADLPNQTRAGLAFVRFDQSGRACIYTQQAAHVVADLQGYMVQGRFDDIVDQRVLDTRSGPRPGNGGSTPISGRPNSTAVVSLVAAEAAGAGYVQVLDWGSSPGSSSNLNVDRRGQIVAGLALVHFDSSGRACLFNQTATHLIADVQGYLADGAFDDIVDVRVLDTRTRSS